MRLTKQQREENEDRVERGLGALEYYAERLHGGSDAPHTDLCDLLADIMHLAHSTRKCGLDERMDFAQALVSAKMHFDAELKGEP